MTDDDRLVHRCLAGDQAACTELVEVHSRMVGTVIWRATGDSAVVEDLAQETFLRAFRALPYFAGRSKLSTWLCTIAHRVAIDHVRKARVRPEDIPLSVVDDAPAAGRGPRGTHSGRSPESDAIDRDLHDLVREHLARLPDKFRLPLVYSAIDGLDYDTIAAMLELPVGTVKTHVFRGKTMLRALIREVLNRPTGTKVMRDAV